MLRPKTRTAGYSTVQLPEFTGGVNSKDAATSIKDNQLTEAQNIFFNEGEFKTRYGFSAVGEPFDTAYVCQSEAKTKIPWDWIGNKSHTLSSEHLIEERYAHDGSNWVVTNKYEFRVKSVYIVHNSFRNRLKSDNRYSTHVYGNVNTWLITDTNEKVQAYLPQSQPSDTNNPVSEENPGQLMFNYYTTRYMTYSGKPVKEKGLGMFLYICGRYGGEKSNQKFRLYELMHTKDTGYGVSLALKQDRISYVWERITDEEFYTPTVLVNGKGNTYAHLPSNANTKDAPQSLYESFNMMCPKFKACFTTDGYNSSEEENVMKWKGSRSFTIPWKVARKQLSDGTYVLTEDFQIYFTDSRGVETKITIPKDANYVDNQNIVANGFMDVDIVEDYIVQARVQIKLYSKKATVFFYYNSQPGAGSSATQRFDLPRAFANNLIFEGYTTDEGRAAILGDMGGCEWFGGNAEGLSGGTRLFLYGGEYDSNRLLWSDVDNPLYFPENNFCYIGSQGDGITKLAKQGEKLVVFKEHSVHYTTYVDNSNSYTASDVLNGVVSDVASVSAVFPITQISGEIGCDLPSTVQLCDNHLVWCTTESKIYTLKTTDKYSENNIYELSYPISTELRKVIEALRNEVVSPVATRRQFINRNSFAIDYDGAYWLWIADTIFVMNYADSGFKYAYSYREGNSVKRSIGFNVLKVDNICRKANVHATIFNASVKYTVQELLKLKPSQYNFVSLTMCAFYKSTGFIKGRNGLFFILEGKITQLGNRGDVMSRSAQLFELTKDGYDDVGMRDITEVGNNTANIDGFKTVYGEEHNKPINAEFTTKLYDFGGTSSKKRFEHIYFDVVPKIDSTITIYAHTERGKELLKIVPVYKVEGTKSEHIRCNLHGVRRLALEISISGAAAIGGFEIKYKNLGR